MEDAPIPAPNISLDLVLAVLDFGLSVTASALASFVFMLMCIHYLYKCVSRRLWLFPCYPAAPFISLNAATLALLGFFIKPPPVPAGEFGSMFDFFYSMMGSVLASALIGACMPSIATADRSQIWSNAAGAALLLMTIIFKVLYKEILIHDYRLASVIDLSIIIICVSLAILVLIVQACNSDVMISEVAACISIRLQQLEIMDPKSISERGGLCRIGWEDLERRTYTKLMMGLTSNLQNVASRSPSSAILAISFLVTTWMSGIYSLFPMALTLFTPVLSVLVLGIICVTRSLRLAIHDCLPLRSLLFDTQLYPLYRHHKTTDIWLKLKAGPPRPLQPARSMWRHTIFSLTSKLYCISALIMLSFIIPIHWIVLVCIRYTHVLTTLLVRILRLTSLRINALLLCMKHMLWRCASQAPALGDSAPPYACLEAGVIHVAGEDPRTVHRLFAASAKLVIQRQIKKAATKPTEALETLLKLSTQACFFENSVVYEVLDERGIPDVGMLHAGCQYGDQYGWGLTALSLLVVMSKVELEALGTSKTTVAAMEAYEQARQMVQVVDEMHIPLLRSKETYLKVSASMWSSLLNKSRSWPKASSRLVQTNVSVVDILDAMLRSALSQLQECAHVFPWAKEVVKAYTMYTVCHNLRRWCTNNGASQLVEHIEFLMAEVLAGCLCSLPAVLETRTRRAVRDGHVAEIENAVLLVCQGQQIWKKLQWPECKVDLLDVPAPGFPLNQYWLQRRTSTQAAAAAATASSARRVRRLATF